MLEIKKYQYALDGKTLFCLEDYKVQSGDKIWVQGESGSGKSLFILGLVGWYAKNAHVDIDFQFDTGNNPTEDEDFLTKHHAIIFQQPREYLNPLIPCGNQIMEAAHQDIENPQFEVLRLCNELQLKYDERIFKVLPKEISIGEAQRVMIAMALIRRCPLLLADEPFAHLDMPLAKHCLDFIETEVENIGGAFMISSHDASLLKEKDYQKLFLHSQKKESIPHSVQREKSAQTPVVIELKNLSKKYDKKLILQNLDLEIHQGERIGLFGVSGSGKSTLSQILSGFEQPTSVDVSTGVPKHFSLFKIWSRKPSTVFVIYQDPYSSFQPSLNMKRQFEDLQKAKDLLPLFSLNESMLERIPSQLSGGELQRMCIIRGLASHRLPELLILDEGLSALDEAMRNTVLSILEEKYPKIAVLFISHRMKIIEPFCDVIYELVDGRLVKQQAD